MDFVLPIIVVVIAFLGAVGGFYLVRSMKGPRRLSEVQQMIRAGKHKEAIGHLRELAEADDRSMMVRYLLGVCYARTKENSLAVTEFRQCIRIGKWSEEVSEVKVRRGLGEALVEIGNQTDAKNEFLILTQLEPDIFENYYQLGRLFFRSEVHDKAIKFLAKAVSLNDKHVDSLYLLGQAQYHIKNYPDARAALLKATQLKPDLRVAHYFLGLVLRNLGDADWALKELELAERDEGIRDRVILAKAMVLFDQESYPKAISELQRGMKFAATNLDSLLNMRYLLASASEKVRDMHTAIENWEAIESLRPGFRDVREKLSQYADMRMDDSLKDFMIANNTQFEAICRKIVEKMSYAIQSVDVKSDSTAQVLASVEEDAAGRRQMKKQNVLIQIERNLEPVSEKRVRDFQEGLKERGASRGIIMTTGDVTPAASAYASSRPIELLDASKMAQFVRAATA